MNKVIFTEILLHVVIQGLRFFFLSDLGALLLKVRFLDQQHQHHLGTF